MEENNTGNTGKGKELERSSATGGHAAGSSADVEQGTAGKGKKVSGTQSEDGNNSKANAPGRSQDGTKRTSVTGRILSKVTGKK